MATPEKQTPFIELGRAGLNQSGGFILEDFVWQLRGQRGAKIYREIGDNSAVAGACLLSLKQIMRSTKWRVDPFDKYDQEAVDIARFVDECREDMETSWEDVTTEAHSMLQYGYAPMEVVYKRRLGPEAEVPSQHADGKVGWRKISLRAQETIWQWILDDGTLSSVLIHGSKNPCGDILGLAQMAPPLFIRTEIPIEKLLLFRTSTERNNPEGRSLLRSAYYSYWFSKKLSELAGIGAERDLAGIPVGRAPAAAMVTGADPAAAEAYGILLKILETMRNHEQASITLPSDVDPVTGKTIWDIELLKSGGAKQFDVLALIQHFELRMALALLMDTILLGHERVGTQALADQKTNLLTRCLGGFLDAEAGVFNRQAIPRLLKLNGMDLAKAPKLSHTGVSETDVQGLALTLKTLAEAGVDVFPDEILTQHVYQVAGLPIEGRVQAEEAKEEAVTEAGAAADEAGQAAVAQPGGQAQQPKTPERLAQPQDGAMNVQTTEGK
jgi:hypothetical protein